jgi:hypothetical protein
MATSTKKELGYFGNIWVRQHNLEKTGDHNDGGHIHFFDHVTMLVRGKVRVDVLDTITKEERSKEFEGPTFMVIRKDHKHKITALTDDVQYYCVFALRDVDGDVTDVYSSKNDPTVIPIFTTVPMADGVVDDDYWVKKKLEDLDKATSHDHDED